MSAPTKTQASAVQAWEELSPAMQRWLLRAVPMRGNGRHLDANTPLGTSFVAECRRQSQAKVVH